MFSFLFEELATRRGLTLIVHVSEFWQRKLMVGETKWESFISSKSLLHSGQCDLSNQLFTSPFLCGKLVLSKIIWWKERVGNWSSQLLNKEWVFTFYLLEYRNIFCGFKVLCCVTCTTCLNSLSSINCFFFFIFKKKNY